LYKAGVVVEKVASEDNQMIVSLKFLPLQYALMENLIEQSTANDASILYDACKGKR